MDPPEYVKVDHPPYDKFRQFYDELIRISDEKTRSMIQLTALTHVESMARARASLYGRATENRHEARKGNIARAEEVLGRSRARVANAKKQLDAASAALVRAEAGLQRLVGKKGTT